MKRTSKLMTSVAASLMLTDTTDALANAAPAFNQADTKQTESKASENWKKDPEVRKAAEAVFDRLKGTTKEKAQTPKAIQESLPGLRPKLVEDALKLLFSTGRITQTNGAYYEVQESHG